jgi:hypothetical protein
VSVGTREAKVFAALVVSMATGIIILQALGNNPPSAGAFCLSRYTQTVPVEEAVLSRVGQGEAAWDSIEVPFYAAWLIPTMSTAILLSATGWAVATGKYNRRRDGKGRSR